MSNELLRAARLRAVALEFRVLAARGDDGTLRARLLESADELEALAEALDPTLSGDVVWDETSAAPPEESGVR